MPTPSLFVTGTDTGVGKTVVTALLALRLQARGVDVGVMKPFATGCGRDGPDLVSEDARWLQAVTGVQDDLDLINPVRFEESLAPLVASRRAGSSGRDYVAECRRAYQELGRLHECVVVEGIGGLMVPLQESGGFLTCLDLANALALPVVVVARRTLGTINHTVLTCRVPLEPPAHVAGLIFCDAQPVAEDDVAAQTSPSIIEEMTALPSWGRVPYLTDLSPDWLRQTAARSLQVP